MGVDRARYEVPLGDSRRVLEVGAEPADVAGGFFAGAFADEGSAPVAVDEAVAGAAVTVMEDDTALEDVGVVAGVFTGWLRRLDFKERA